jgi:hypothetical protein
MEIVKIITDKWKKRLAESRLQSQSKYSPEEIIDIVQSWPLSGENSDACLEKDFLMVPVHFYQPIPDIKDLERRKVWEGVSKLRGIEFEPLKYLKFLQLLGSKYSKECDWPNEPTSDPDQFFLNNSCFSYGCASALHSMIRECKPQRIIEVGSGFSSQIIRDALLLNKKLDNINGEHIIIDPFCALNLTSLAPNTKILKKKVEETDLSIFKRLKANDILFIDSSHVCKIGSDVNFEILEILPVLKKGVYIHFHDINLPYEYPKAYAINPKFRMFWNESYLLQSFLMFNKDFEIILPMTYIQKVFEKQFRKSFPNGNKAENFGSGSFWIKKIN